MGFGGSDADRSHSAATWIADCESCLASLSEDGDRTGSVRQLVSESLTARRAHEKFDEDKSSEMFQKHLKNTPNRAAPLFFAHRFEFSALKWEGTSSTLLFALASWCRFPKNLCLLPPSSRLGKSGS